MGKNKKNHNQQNLTLHQHGIRSNYFLVGITVLLCMLSSLFMCLYFEYRHTDALLSSNALLFANNPELIERVKNNEIYDGFNEFLSDYVDSNPAIDTISICNLDSIRLYHSNSDLVRKKFIGGDQERILSGSGPYISTTFGSIGLQHRAFHGIYTPEGELVGFIMVSVLEKNIHLETLHVVILFLVISIIVFVIAALATSYYHAKSRKLLLGYEPEELVERYFGNISILDHLEEGIVAVDENDIIIMSNQAACEFVGTRLPAGLPVPHLALRRRLHKIAKRATPLFNLDVTSNNYHLLVDFIPINDKYIRRGALAVMSNKTELMELANQLTGANYMLESMRTFTHDFKNKLHIILGYIELGKAEEAIPLILQYKQSASNMVTAISKQIQQPTISALIIGKMLRANELAISFTLRPDSFCTQDFSVPTDVLVTILGNLLQNSLEELNSFSEGVKEIELGFYCNDEGILITVDDTGRGIPADLLSHVTDNGVTTKGEGHGSGLSIISHLVTEYGGELTIDSEQGTGTSITVSFSSTEL